MEKKTAKSWEGHVLAMKGGGQKWFSDGLWDTGTPQRVGWQRLGDVDAIDEIETEKILIVETKIPDEKVTEEVIVEVAEAKDYPPDKEIREFLEIAGGICHIEMIMKDVSTVMYDPSRLWEWESICMEEVTNYLS